MEKIVKAAIRVNPIDSSSFILVGTRHSDIEERIWDLQITTLPREQGFLTSEGRFVDRVEAKKIAVAADQLIVPLADTYTSLYSEDVW